MLAERVTHDGNQHIQDCDLRQERSEEEEKSCKHLCHRTLTVEAVVEVAEHGEVLLLHRRVEDELTRLEWVEQSIFLLTFVDPVHLQEVHGRAEGEHEHEKDDHEAENITDCAHDKGHVLRRAVEKSEPEEDLHPEHHASDRTYKSHICDRDRLGDAFNDEETQHEDHQVERVRQDVDNVLELADVVPGAIIDELFDLNSQMEQK